MGEREIAKTLIGIGLSSAIAGAGAYTIATLLTPTATTVDVPRGTFLSDAPPSLLTEVPPVDPADAVPLAVAPTLTRQSLARRSPERAAQSAAGSSNGEGPAVPRASRRALPVAAESPDAVLAPPRIRSHPTPDRSTEPPPRMAALQSQPAPKASQPSGPVILSPGEIRRMRLALRLTPDQEVHWPAVEGVLLQIGAQQAALARQGQDVAGAFSSDATMRVYWAARPLLGTLREDQKAHIRLRARTMGLGSVASYL